MRRVTRRHRPKPVYRKMRDYPEQDTDLRTLRQRMAALKPGEGLYPWSVTKLVIDANGARRWIAKRADEQ